MAFAECTSLPEWLATLPTARGRVVFPEAGVEMPYRDLANLAAAFAEVLRSKGVGAGDVVGVLAPAGPEFLVGFLGVLWAGGTASVLPPPSFGVDVMRRLRPLLTSLDIRHVVVAKAFGRVATDLQAQEQVAVLSVTADTAGSKAGPFEPGSAMTMQLTSGSLAEPKGVLISYAAYHSGLTDLHDVGRFSSDDVVALWLPLSHDFGLNTLLCAMATDADVHLVNPQVFIRDPAAFLHYMAKVRATIFASPNFAYERLITASEQLVPGQLDLSSWRMAWSGGEVVRADTVTRFADAFARLGVHQPLMSPVYGMAEVAGPIAGAPAAPCLPILPVDRGSLTPGARVRISADASTARHLVSNGPQFGRSKVRIVDASGAALPEDTIGEIEFKGPSIMSGYRNNAAATTAAFHDGWLRTADIGFVSDGEVYVTGRVKDMIIVAGRNFHAEDVEEIAGRTPGVYCGHCAVVADVEHEKLIVVIELEANADADTVSSAVRMRTQDHLQLSAIDVYPVRRGWLPRTTSGKWRRHKLLTKLATQVGR